MHVTQQTTRVPGNTQAEGHAVVEIWEKPDPGCHRVGREPRGGFTMGKGRPPWWKGGLGGEADFGPAHEAERCPAAEVDTDALGRPFEAWVSHGIVDTSTCGRVGPTEVRCDLRSVRDLACAAATELDAAEAGAAGPRARRAGDSSVALTGVATDKKTRFVTAGPLFLRTNRASCSSPRFARRGSSGISVAAECRRAYRFKNGEVHGGRRDQWGRNPLHSPSKAAFSPVFSDHRAFGPSLEERGRRGGRDQHVPWSKTDDFPGSRPPCHEIPGRTSLLARPSGRCFQAAERRRMPDVAAQRRLITYPCRQRLGAIAAGSISLTPTDSG